MHRIEVCWSKQPVERVEIAYVSEELTASLYKTMKGRHEVIEKRRQVEMK